MGVPSNIIIPFMGIEFDSSQAFTGPATVPIEALLIGQKIAAGTATANTKYSVTNPDQALLLAGSGAHAHMMAKTFFDNISTVPCTMIFLDDAATSTAGTVVVTIGGTSATEARELALYFNGIRIAVSVGVGDTPTTVGDAVVAAVALLDGFPATVANVTGALTFTMKSKGIAAGDIDSRDSYNAGEAVPAGLTVTHGTPSAGTVDPDVQDAIDAIGDSWFNLVANPYTDATNTAAIKTYAAAQDGPMVMKDQIWYGCLRDTRANIITYGLDTTNHNSKHLVTGAWYKRLQSTSEGAAAMVGVKAQSLVDNIEKPLHRLTVNGISALDKNDRWTDTERNQVAVSGIETFTDDVGVQTESTVTMYLKNSAGASDPAYQFQNTVFNLMAQRYRFRVQILTKYDRALLADSSEKIRPGIQVITPNIGRNEALIWYRQLERDGLAEDYDTFKANVVCQRSESNDNRLEWLLPSDLVNQFIVGSADIQFRL